MIIIDNTLSAPYNKIAVLAKMHKNAKNAIKRRCVIMKIENVINKLIPGSVISRREYEEIVRQINPKISDRTIFWQLAKLQEADIIHKIGQNVFYVRDNDINKRDYVYGYSKKMKGIVEIIKNDYPLVDFQVWEFVQLNEFVNHQIGKNVFFIEVEHHLEESIFNRLKQYYSRILLCPKEDMFYNYFEENMVVIQSLLSEVPKTKSDVQGCSLEKLLVDLFSNKLTGQLVERAEYPGIYEEAFRKYYIDEKKLFRYARRRNLEKEIKNFIEKETNIQLVTEDMND